MILACLPKDGEDAHSMWGLNLYGISEGVRQWFDMKVRVPLCTPVVCPLVPLVTTL